MRNHLLLSTAFSAAFLVGFHAFDVQGQVVSGSNLGASGPTIPVDYDPIDKHYVLDVDLLFDPSAGPMTKLFQSPFDPLGQLVLIHPGQTIPVWENFNLILPGRPVSDWHEEVLTPGWEWVIPPQTATTSLITRNGDPWPWQHQPHPGGNDPTMIWVEFQPIEPGNILDVHKELMWVGTPDNSIWGDFTSDDGSTSIDEMTILVLEYPTPEPGTLGLLAIGALGLVRRRR